MSSSVDISAEDAPLAAAFAVVNTPATEIDVSLTELADRLAASAARFVATMEAVAQGIGADETVAILLLEVSDICAMGARLGALSDVVPEGRFEPDPGREADVDGLRLGLAGALAPVDAYIEAFDPYASAELVGGRLSDDLTHIATDLLHGLAHHSVGRTGEALWWWQTTYLGSWGASAASCLRALHSIVAHVRTGAVLE